ncbi:MAG TPA: HIT domain-containing protein [Acidimicrobiales bacterium]|nr:HIT domain-containing protein [Acidimicrobiales bacterium]
MTGTNDDCIFCRIVSGQVPAREAYSGPLTFAFYDQHPVAPVHVLVVPREHIPDAAHLEPQHGPVLAEMAAVSGAIAEREGVAGRGYRLVFNIGRDSGSEVAHLHMHVIGGRRLGWPPG